MIYCVEDDESIQSLELYTLASAGFEARGFGDGDSFLEALRAERPELVILDVMLPGISGVELLKQMKASDSTCDIPIIMATAKGAEYDKIQSLDLGAGDLVIDLAEHTVTADGERLTLTFKEFELLRLFLSSPGMAFTREKLLANVWGGEYSGETRTVDMHIRTLRQKLGRYGAMIETVRSVGYRWEAEP